MAAGDGQPVATDLVGLVVVAVVAQAVLSFAGMMRDDWHAALRAMRLRAKSLPD
jgi:hypothetical protein